MKNWHSPNGKYKKSDIEFNFVESNKKLLNNGFLNFWRSPMHFISTKFHLNLGENVSYLTVWFFSKVINILRDGWDFSGICEGLCQHCETGRNKTRKGKSEFCLEKLWSTWLISWLFEKFPALNRISWQARHKMRWIFIVWASD